MIHRIFVLIAAIALSGCGMEQVDEGYRGVETRFGKVQGQPLPPGLHFFNPITSDVEEFDVRERKLEGSTPCFTNDTQTVTVAYAVTFYPQPDKILSLYSQFGKREWEEKLIPQAVLGSIKDVIGQYKADDMVGKREQARKTVDAELKATLGERGIVITKLDMTNLDFDDAYEKAVEAKVVATQRAIEAKNKTVQVEEEAKQTIASAKAEAESMRIKSQALSQNKGLVEFEIAQKWNGVLPEIMMGSSIPMLNLDRLKK